jgi:hypothetical protein
MREYDRGERRQEGEEGELNVADPDVALGVFQHHLEVNACEAGREAGGGDGKQACHLVHDVQLDGVVILCAGCIGLYLHNPDTDREKEEGDPLTRQKLFPQEEDRECSGRENLHLIADLKRGRV